MECEHPGRRQADSVPVDYAGSDSWALLCRAGIAWRSSSFVVVLGIIWCLSLRLPAFPIKLAPEHITCFVLKWFGTDPLYTLHLS